MINGSVPTIEIDEIDHKIAEWINSFRDFVKPDEGKIIISRLPENFKPRGIILLFGTQEG
jgi:hypothetical protein